MKLLKYWSFEISILLLSHMRWTKDCEVSAVDANPIMLIDSTERVGKIADAFCQESRPCVQLQKCSKNVCSYLGILTRNLKRGRSVGCCFTRGEKIGALKILKSILSIPQNRCSTVHFVPKNILHSNAKNELRWHDFQWLTWDSYHCHLPSWDVIWIRIQICLNLDSISTINLGKNAISPRYLPDNEKSFVKRRQKSL